MRCVLTFFVCFCIVSTLTAQEQRIWTDHTGKFKVEAVLIKVDGEQVRIKKTDGKFLTLALSKLSEEDQKYIETTQFENPFAGGSETDDESSESMESGNATNDDSVAPPSRKKSASSARKVDLQRAATGAGATNTRWSCEADPLPETLRSKGKTRNIMFVVGDLPFTTHARFSEFHFSDTGSVLIAANVESHHDERSKPFTQIFFGSVESGRCISYKTSEKIASFGLSPDGSKAIFRKEAWGFGLNKGTRGTLVIAKADSEAFEPIAEYKPFGQEDEPRNVEEERGGSRGFPTRFPRPLGASSFSQRNSDIEWAAWVDNDRVLLLSEGGLLVLFDTKTGEALWKVNGGFHPTVVLSPGRRYCLLTSPHGATFFNALTGEPIGALDSTSGRGFASYAFSPNGKTIASVSKDEIFFWDATTGKKGDSFLIGENSKNSFLAWIDDRYLLAGNILVNVERKLPVWRYEFGSGLKCFAGQVWYLASRLSADTMLCGVEIPHSPVLELPQTLTLDDAFFVHPGGEISLQLDPTIRENRNEITKSLEDKLKANGLRINPATKTRFVLSLSKEKPIQVFYGVNESGAPLISSGGQGVWFQPYRFELKIEKKNETIWSTALTTQPPSLISRDDLKKIRLQDAVNRSASTEILKNWCQTVTIPRWIRNPEWKNTSRLQENGIVDQR